MCLHYMSYGMFIWLTTPDVYTNSNTSSQASKLLNKKPGFLSSFLGTGNSNFEEAADLFKSAAIGYKTQRMYLESGNAFLKQADCELKTDSPDEAANTLVEAYKVFKLESPDKAAETLERAIAMFVKKGQFRRAANFKSELGELYENQLHNIGLAIKSYEESSDWYLGDSANALSNKFSLKAADLYCDETVNQFAKASQVFERIAKESVNNSLAKWSLKEYFLKAILCRLAEKNDYASGEALISRFASWDPSFAQTREYEFCKELILAVKDGEVDGVSAASRKFDQFQRLDSLKVKLLNIIKSNVQEGGSFDQVEEDFT